MCDQRNSGIDKRQDLKESKGPAKWRGFFYVYNAPIYSETNQIRPGWLRINLRCCIISISFGPYKMMIWCIKFLFLSHLFAMYMTVYFMVINTQDMFAAQKHTFPVISRGL